VIKFKVGVDSGTIGIARNPNNLDKGLHLYSKVQELALESAAAVWDGKKGAISTPHGDDVYTVIYDYGRKYNWKEWQERRYVILINLPRGEVGKAFTLYVGDVGQVQGSIDFPDHTLIMCGWEDDMTLVFISEYRPD